MNSSNAATGAATGSGWSAIVWGLTAFVLQHQWITALLYVYFTVSCVQGLQHWARAEV